MVGQSQGGAQFQGGAAADITATLRLTMLPGLGPRTLANLLQRFGDPRSILAASVEQLLTVTGVGDKLARAIDSASERVEVTGIIDWCVENGVEVVCRDHQRYPGNLQDLVDAPPLLFVRGLISPQDELAVAVVGTRHPTNYGIKQAERFGYSLAKAGITVISGLARGIDVAAHDGAMNAGGRTIAVLGSGLGQVYPEEHAGLAERISQSGAVISEFAPQAKPRSGMFPQRNRLIAGLALCTLVIEAPDRSGALITARLAGEQNRDVLALPGPVSSRASRGCNQLIRDGATLVQTVDDVLESIGPMRQPIKTEAGYELRNGRELKLNELERGVLDAIDEVSTPIDQVIERSQLPPHRVLATISVLEMRRLIRRLSGQYVARR